MNSFTLQLQGATRGESIAGVASFVGEDASGQFGIQAGHARFMTALLIGLARFQVADQPWEYLALPGAVLYFRDDVLTLGTRLYFRDRDYGRISTALREEVVAEEEDLRGMKESLLKLEQEMLRRLSTLGRGGEAIP